MKALPPSLLALSVIFMVGCKSGEMKELEERIEVAKSKIERTADRLDKEHEKLAKEEAANKVIREEAQPAIESEENRERMIVEIGDKLAKLPELEGRLLIGEVLLEKYAEKFVPVSPPEGTPLGNLNLADGTTLVSAVYVKNLGDRVQLKHARGIATVATADLPESAQALFVLPPKESSASKTRLADILAMKPRNLQSEKDLLHIDRFGELMAEREEEERKKQQVAEAQRKAEAKLAADQRRKQEEMARDQRRKEEAAKREKVNEIRDKIRILSNQISELQSAKFSRLSEMQSRSIRPSKADILKMERGYDAEIHKREVMRRQLEAERRQLEAELSRP